ncbi:MAG: MFS transporter [Actinomycetota bacterium]
MELVDELVDGVFRATLPLIRNELELDYGQVGLLLGLPAIISNFVEPYIALGADLWRRRVIIAAGGIAFAVALGSIAAAPSFVVLLACFVLFFPASGAFVSISQASLMDADPVRREQNMARWTVAGYVGNVLGPLGVATAVALGAGWRGTYAVLAVISLVALVRMMRFPFVRSKAPHPSLRHAVSDALRQLRRGSVVRWLVMLEALDLMLDVLTAFLALYLVDVGNLTTAQAAIVIGARSAAGLVGELGVVALLERIPGVAYLRVSVLATTLLYPALLLVDPVWAKVSVAIVLGFVTAGWYSIIQAQLYAALPDRSGTALALKNVTGSIWGVVPIALGAVAERFGITTMMWLLWAGPLTLLLGVPWRYGRQPQRTGKE